MPSQIEKLEAHASHLLDAFIQLKEKFALLEPMLFDKDVVTTRGSSRQARGFNILRYSLFLSCAQDIAKLCLDSDCRTPSILNIVASLDDVSLRKELENRHSIWVLPSAETETDPDIVAALKRLEEQERNERRTQFLAHIEELTSSWGKLKISSVLSGLLTLRDKVTAHTEVRYVEDKYEPIDIGRLGIKWGDLRSTIETMQRLVELIGLIIRNACFAWNSLNEQLASAGADFWCTSDAA